MLRTLAGLIVAFLAFASPALAQQVTPPTGMGTIVCAYNSAPPTITSGFFGYVQCDSSGKLITSGGGGSGGAVTLAPGAVSAGAYVAGALVAGAAVDGWDITQGTKGDAACATPSSSCSISSLLHAIFNGVQGYSFPSTTAGQSLSLIGGATTTSPPTESNAQTNPLSLNTHGALRVVNGADTYNTIAASQTAQALTGGSGGATSDFLSHCVAFPTSTSPGVVTILDNSTTVYAFPGGASSVSNLVPFSIPIGSRSVSGAWKVTTGANISVVCTGSFT